MLKAARASDIAADALAGRSPLQALDAGELPVWRSPDEEGRHALSMRRLASYATEEGGERSAVPPPAEISEPSAAETPKNVVALT